MTETVDLPIVRQVRQEASSPRRSCSTPGAVVAKADAQRRGGREGHRHRRARRRVHACRPREGAVLGAEGGAGDRPARHARASSAARARTCPRSPTASSTRSNTTAPRCWWWAAATRRWRRRSSWPNESTREVCALLPRRGVRQVPRGQPREDSRSSAEQGRLQVLFSTDGERGRTRVRDARPRGQAARCPTTTSSPASAASCPRSSCKACEIGSSATTARSCTSARTPKAKRLRAPDTPGRRRAPAQPARLVALSRWARPSSARSGVHRAATTTCCRQGARALKSPLHTLPQARRAFWGHGVGIVATLFMMSNFLYAARKRSSLLKGVGAIRRWLTLHVFVGFMSPLVIVFHAAFQSNNLLASVDRASLAVLVSTGLIGRFSMALVPQREGKLVDSRSCSAQVRAAARPAGGDARRRHQQHEPRARWCPRLARKAASCPALALPPIRWLRVPRRLARLRAALRQRSHFERFRAASSQPGAAAHPGGLLRRAAPAAVGLARLSRGARGAAGGGDRRAHRRLALPRLSARSSRPEMLRLAARCHRLVGLLWATTARADLFSPGQLARAARRPRGHLQLHQVPRRPARSSRRRSASPATPSSRRSIEQAAPGFHGQLPERSGTARTATTSTRAWTSSCRVGQATTRTLRPRRDRLGAEGRARQA